MAKRMHRRRYGLPVHVELLETRRLLSVATTTVLVPSASSIAFGATATFTATIAAHGATPTGEVDFENGTTLLGTAALSGGSASFATTSLPSGVDSIKAVYTGATGFSGSSSSTIRETVTPIGTTTTLSASSNPITVGQVVTLTATVTAGSGSPGGSVAFVDDKLTLGTEQVNTGTGQAVFAGTAHFVGVNDIKAVYSGTNGYSASSSTTLPETVNADPTVTTLIASADSGTFGQIITYTAVVTSTSGEPAGSVTFLDGSQTLGKENVNTHNGSAVLATAGTSAGAETITAVYVSSTASFSGSMSSGLSEMIQPESTVTTLKTSANPGTFGQTLTLTATVTAAVGSPSGTVTFLNGIETIGTAVLNGSHEATLATVLPLGTASITAVYGASDDFTASSSAAISLPVNPAVTVTSLSASITSAAKGEGVTLTATVSGHSSSPTGEVTFLDGTNTLGVVAVNGSTHKATLATSALPLGANSISADYGGATGYDASNSNVVIVTVNPAQTRTSLNVEPNKLIFGDNATLTATVTSTSGNPGGSVTFLEGTATLGTASINTTTHDAVFDDSNLPVGNDSITAVYTGQTGFAASTGAKTVTVGGIPTTVALVSSAKSAAVGQTVTFTATVTASSGTASGTVTFLQNGATLGTAPINTSNNMAVLETALLQAGMENIRAVFASQNGFKTSSSPTVTETISPDMTTTTVTDNGSGGTVGTVVTFSATVTNASGFGGTPAGDVVFTSGLATLGMVSLNSSGVATLTEFDGDYNIQANYVGNGSFAASFGNDQAAATLPTLTPFDGLNYAVLTSGSGPYAGANGFVAINYTAYLTDGTTLFDSSLNPDRIPDAFPLGEPSNIQAFNDFLPYMEAGEVAVLDIPSALAFGSTAYSTVPANSTVIYVVQMESLTPARLSVTNTNGLMVGNNQTPSADNGTNFGTVAVGRKSSVQTFVLGDADSAGGTALFDLSLNGPVQITGDTGDFVISQPGGIGGDLTIRFIPQTQGTRTATIIIPSNDPNVPDFSFTVTGVGT